MEDPHYPPAYRPPLNQSLISVILPVFDESRILPDLLRSVTEVLDACGTDHEILFVNDGSHDPSAAILDAMAAGDRRVRVIHLSRNFGHQAAVQAGLTHARGDAVVLMDSDMQDAPEAIARFLAEWQAGYDVVYATRTRRKESRPKRLLFDAFHWLMSRVASVPIPADAGNFGLVDGRLARLIAALGERDRYFPGLRSWVGFRQTGVEVERSRRYDEHPRVSILGLVRLAKTAIFSFSPLPLVMFHVMGMLAAALFVGLSGFSLFCKLCTGLAIPGWTSQVLVGSFFGALNALGIWIIGEYVIRIYDQVRGRPLYLVDRVVNLPIEPPYTTRRDTETSDADDLAADQPYLELMEEATSLLDAGTVPAPRLHA